MDWEPPETADALVALLDDAGQSELVPFRLARTPHISPAQAFWTDEPYNEDAITKAQPEAVTADAKAARAIPVMRTAQEHAALVDELQAELLADDLDPPESATAWTEATLRCWFEDGGRLTMRAIQCDTARALDVDSTLASLPRHRLELLEVGELPSTGLVGALHRRDTTAFAALASRFGADGWAACRLGLPAALWETARDEGARAWPLMRPNHITTPLGDRIVGRSPSGAERGDRYIMAQTLPGGAASFPVLTALDELMAIIGSALAPAVREEASCLYADLMGASHAQCAIFPGNGARYGAHFDGDGYTTRMTMILYTSAGWAEADGGELCVLDEGHDCWRALPPREDTLLIFRSERVLHQVCPSYRSRLALTAFFTAGKSSAMRRTARDPSRYQDSEYDDD